MLSGNVEVRGQGLRRGGGEGGRGGREHFGGGCRGGQNGQLKKGNACLGRVAWIGGPGWSELASCRPTASYARCGAPAESRLYFEAKQGVRNMESLEQLPQLEQLCERLYNAQDHAERKHAETVLAVFSSSSEYAPQCKAILDNSSSPYAQLVSRMSFPFLGSVRSSRPQPRIEVFDP